MDILKILLFGMVFYAFAACTLQKEKGIVLSAAEIGRPKSEGLWVLFVFLSIFGYLCKEA